MKALSSNEGILTKESLKIKVIAETEADDGFLDSPPGRCFHNNGMNR
jgi:hypothetical protein